MSTEKRNGTGVVIEMQSRHLNTKVFSFDRNHRVETDFKRKTRSVQLHGKDYSTLAEARAATPKGCCKGCDAVVYRTTFDSKGANATKVVDHSLKKKHSITDEQFQFDMRALFGPQALVTY